MESDDDYQFFSPPDEPSPQIQHRRLKRLKKVTRVSEEPPVQSVDEETDSPELQALESSEPMGFEDLSEKLQSQSPVQSVDEDTDSPELQAPESSEPMGFEDSGEKLQSQSPSDGFEEENGLKSGFDGLCFDDNRREAKRALNFDAMDDESEEKGFDQSQEVEEKIADLKMERSEKKRLNEEKSNANKSKKKKRVKSVGDEAKPKTYSLNKRKEEKQRRAHLQQLHAESQRLLRETRDAAFKPIPIVQKPISSILEKIRQRKLEVLKKSAVLNNNCFITEDNGYLREDMLGVELKTTNIEERGVEKLGKALLEETIVCPVDVEGGSDASCLGGSKDATTHSSQDNVPSDMAFDGESSHAFRAPVDDTQDLFSDSQMSDGKDELPDDPQSSHLEEVLAPSVLAMNLKFDSAPVDDVSSDEEDNDKENLDPHPHRLDGCSSPKGDLVKAFVDDEALEEDDSDNDLFRFQENEEDEGNEDLEELNDLIATGYEEKPIDNDRRNELHQKWLEQQDASGTENLLQRLKCGSVPRDLTLLQENEDEDEEEFSDDASEYLVPTGNVRINSRKAKQMIAQMFSDKDDPYLSSDDEETEKRLTKQRVLERALSEKRSMFLSPADDESSGEVFGLIKKLNNVPDTKKKAKTSSFFDTMLGGASNSSSKSSFLGRASSHSLASSNKKGTNRVRSFIFGRDDSNSRSSIPTPEDSSDTVPIETHSTRNHTTKFSYSQSKTSTQTTNVSAQTVPGTSLFDILKQSSVQSNVCNQDNTIGLTQNIFATFKVPRKQIKVEGRT